MTRGTVNENAVINAFEQHAYIDSVHKVGMLCNKERPWIAASPDAIATFDLNTCFGNDVLSDETAGVHVALVEIKTAVARSTVAVRSNMACPELIFCEMDTDEFREHVPKEHAAQIVHQCVAADLRWFFYISTSESQILFVVLSRCLQELFLDVRGFYDDRITPALRRAHANQVDNQLLTGNGETDRLISARLPFWRMVSKDIASRGPFVPVHIFKHASQVLYNKTKGGVDGNTQMRALLRCPSDTLRWEQKVVTQLFKSVTVNAWIAWRQIQKQDLLDTRELFKGLEQYRNALNRVEPFPDFIHELTPNCFRMQKLWRSQMIRP